MKTPMYLLLGFVLVGPLCGCNQPPPSTAPPKARTALPKLPTAWLEDIEIEPILPAAAPKKSVDEINLTSTSPVFEVSNEDMLKVRLAELAARKAHCKHAIRYTEDVRRYIQQHENTFAANWNPSDVEWAGPIEPILDAYRLLRSKCDARLRHQQQELQRTEAEWARADAELRKSLAASK